MTETPVASLPWLRVRSAESSVLVVAPHGGRRHRSVRRSDGVNDLYTAEIAWDIAERLDAQALINEGLDRNQADLNRISDLCEKAPEFLSLLRKAVESAPDGRLLLLFVHGWNMTLPCCDIGVGLRRRDQQLFGRYPTVSRECFQALVPALEKSFDERGLGTELGMRYPGIGADNAMQLFSRRHRDHDNADVCAIAAAALAGRAEAVQLELGIPLRWQGALRDSTVDAVVEAVNTVDIPACGPSQARKSWKLPPANKLPEGDHEVESGYGVQAAIDDGGLGLFAGVEATGKASMAARICVVREDGTMLLFVTESGWDGMKGRYQTQGLKWQADSDDVWRAEFAGPIVAYPTHDAYEDLETGLASSSLATAEVRLVAKPLSDLRPPFRELSYEIAWNGAQGIDDDSIAGCCVAVCERGGRRGSGLRRAQSGEGSDTARLFFTSGREPEALEDVDLDSGVHGAPTARVPVWRPAPGGVLTRFTFGTLRSSDGRSMGVYDRLEVFAAKRNRPT